MRALLVDDVVDDAVWLEQHPLLTFYDRVAEARAGCQPPLIVRIFDAVFVFVNGVFRLLDQIVNLMWRLP